MELLTITQLASRHGISRSRVHKILQEHPELREQAHIIAGGKRAAIVLVPATLLDNYTVNQICKANGDVKKHLDGSKAK